ncbi:hypothetical protein HK104_006546 [Borealophlyctis nickersoniae]|nr:hypothetical protein HK104_006546 [Borealophlyctis nickersoniae]
MSSIPPRQNNGVFIPPRRVATGNTGTPYYGAPIEPGAVRTPGAPPGPIVVAPRIDSAGSVNIPRRNASAQGIPERQASVNPNRTTFQPPPRTVIPNYGNSVYVQPGSYAQPGAYAQPQGGYHQPAGGYVQPAGYSLPSRPSISSGPAPRVTSLGAAPNYESPQIYIPPHNNAQASPPLTETHYVASDPNSHSRRPSSVHSVNEPDSPSVYPRGPSFDDEPRPGYGAFVNQRLQIRKRETSLQPITVDDLLDSGGEAFAAPRHNIEEALAKWRQARSLAVEKKDLLREAKALSNIGCALRVQGRLEESLSELLAAWEATTHYVIDASQRFSSLWLQLVMLHADIDGDAEGYGDGGQRPSSIHEGRDGAHEVSQGPPIVVWFLQLTTNLGNAYYSLGNYSDAIHYHDMCRRLAEAVLEEYPLPATFGMPLSRVASTASVNSGTTLVGASDTNGDNRRDSTSTKAKIKLSYLHRQTLLAQARALSHLGLCHQQLGLDDEALSCQLQAEAIVTFYSTRAQQSHSSQTRRSSATQTHVEHMEVQVAEASIVANVGTAHHAKGRILSALQYHERAGNFFRAIPDGLNSSKETANVGCLYMEVGKTINSLQWIRSMEMAGSNTGGGDAELFACKRFWGPPRLDHVNMGSGAVDESAAAEMAGKSMFDQGMVSLYEEARVLRAQNDWFGMVFIWANLAVGYVMLNQPYLALYYLSKLTQEVHLDTPPSPPHTPPIARRAARIPEVLRPHVYFALSQALFLLTRMQDFDLTQPLFPDPVDGVIPDHGTTLPVMDGELMRQVLASLGAEMIDPNSLNNHTVLGLLDGCKRVLDELKSVRSQAAATLYASGSATFDTQRQRSVLTEAARGKIEWARAGKRSCGTNERTGHYVESRNALLNAAREMASTVRGEEPSAGTLRSDSGFVPLLLDVAADATDPAIADDEAREKVTPVGPHLFALAADMLASAKQRTKDYADGGIDLSLLLGVGSGPRGSTVARAQLLEAAKYLYAAQIGCCEACATSMVAVLAAPTRENEEQPILLFAGPDARMSEGPKVKVFPCPHYQWKTD